MTKPPLIEVIFEIRFKEFDLVDYDLFAGELYSNLKSEYPRSQTLKPKEMPAFLLPHVMQHRFRPGLSDYPLYQIGPGITSFNIDGPTYSALGEDENNNWELFRQKIISFVESYRAVMGSNFTIENIEHFSLRFVNKIEDTEMYPGLKKYFSEKLNLKIDLDFIKGNDCIENLESTQLTQAYTLSEEEESKLELNIATITESATRKLLVDISVTANKLPALAGIDLWLDNSHSEIKAVFEGLISNIKDLFE